MQPVSDPSRILMMMPCTLRKLFFAPSMFISAKFISPNFAFKILLVH